MAKVVVSDPVALRPVRESAPGRQAPAARPQDAFETMLDTSQAPRPARAERAERTERPDRTERPERPSRSRRNDARPAEDGSPRTETRRVSDAAKRSDQPVEPNSDKPAASPGTRQAKDGQSSVAPQPGEAVVAPDVTVQSAEEFAHVLSTFPLVNETVRNKSLTRFNALE